MQNQHIVVLNGWVTIADEDVSASVLSVLLDEISKCGATVQTYHLQDIQMGTCTGCFGCWLKTPGICVEPDMRSRDCPSSASERHDHSADARDLWRLFLSYQENSGSLATVAIALLWPISRRDSSYASLCALSPPGGHWYSAGNLTPIEANLFKVLVGRNAINFHAPTHAAEVVLRTATLEEWRQQFQAVLMRNDAIPVGKVVTSLMPTPDPVLADEPMSDRPGRALLLVGSPKVKEPEHLWSFGPVCPRPVAAARVAGRIPNSAEADGLGGRSGGLLGCHRSG
jgi:hypothetical protein